MPIIHQLLLVASLMVAVTMIHGGGIALINRTFRFEDHDFTSWRLIGRELRVMIPMALVLLTLHIIEIGVFASFYLHHGQVATVDQAMYDSALAYTTMGLSEEGGLAQYWLVLAFEGLVGFVMIGWSSAVFVTFMDKLLRSGR